MTVPVYLFDQRKASDAWEAHSELLKLMIRNPSLRDNPVWTLLRQEAYELLCEAYKDVTP